jgi:glycosyltransferase involved in cell wall biosynthesis
VVSRLRVHALIDSLTWGGAEMLLADLAAGAPAAGIELSVGYLLDVDGSPAAGRLRDRGVEPDLVEVGSILSRADRARVRSHVEAVAPDVLHTHLANADVLGGLAGRSLGVPVVSSVHVMRAEPGLRDRARTAVTNRVRRRTASRVIAVSDAARAWLVEAGWADPERLVTVHNGVAAEPRPGAGRAVRAELGIGPDELVATMLTVLRPGKGHDTAVAAATLLAERHPRLRLLLVGDGPARPEVEALAARLGERALLAGHRDDVMAVLDATDVLLHPSSIDAFPTALLEAMAAGVPVVSTRVGGIPEIVDEGETGTLIDAPPDPAALAAALEPYLADDELRRRVGDHARERFGERFTAARWAERLRLVYSSVI